MKNITEKLKYLLFIMCFALLFVMGKPLIKANDNNQGGVGGEVPTCKGSSCTWGFPGFRITVVDRATGERCKYDESTNTICASTGITSDSVDVWYRRFDDKYFGSSGVKSNPLTGVSWGYNSGCWTVRGRRTKKEFIAGSKEIVRCSTDNKYVSSNIRSMTYFGFPSSPSGTDRGGGYYENWKFYIDNSYSTYYNPQNFVAIRAWLECQQNNKFFALHPESGRGAGYCQNKRPDFTVFNNILNYLYYGDKNAGKIDALRLNNRDAARLQFEHLISVYAESSYKDQFIGSATGTVAEVAYICNQSGTRINEVTQSSEGSACSSTKSLYSMWTGWYGENYSWSENGSWYNSWIRRSNWNTPSSESELQSTYRNGAFSKFYAKDTIGLTDFWIDPDPCTRDLNIAMTLGTEAARKEAFSKLKEYGTEYGELPMTMSYDVAKFLYDNGDYPLTCSRNCADEARTVYRYNQSHGNVKIGSRNYNYEDALIEVTKGNTLETIVTEENYYKNQWHSTYMKYQRKLTAGFFPTSCDIVDCVQGNVDKMWVFVFKRNEEYNQDGYSYDEYFNDWLFKATNSVKYLLKPEFWQIVGEEGPSCDNITPCDADTNINNACGEKIVLEDYKFGANDEEAQKCWQRGFAYTNNRANPVGSFVKQIGTNSKVCKLYCSEQVSFNFPSAVGEDKAIRAGTIFKWGINSDTKTSLYGEMTIVKKCAVRNPQILDGNGDRFTPDCTGNQVYYSVDEWASEAAGLINTEFDLNYEDPLKEYLYKGKTYIVQDSYHDAKSISNVTCADSTCSNLSPETLTTQATFDILYQENLNWYGNKTTGEPESKSDIVKKPDGTKLLPWYKWIGYGLPTAFMTPNGTYGADWKDKNGNGDGIFDGMLSLTIGNIGTSYHNGNDYHFDELIKQKFGDKTITYSCAFRIINELFGNDCKYEEDSMGNLVLTADSPAYCDPTDDDKVDDPSGSPDDPSSNSRRYIRDIDVVFRVIDLISDSNVAPNGSIIGNAFPGILGNGRVRGRNWAKLSDSEVEDILREDIYQQKQPMYSLELNTANIQYIRELNRKARSSNDTYNAADPYTEMRRFNGDNDLTDISSLPGYTGYYCVNYSGVNATTDTSIAGQDIYKYCASRFLSLLASDSFKTHGGAQLGGSCVGHNSTAQERALKYVKPTDGQFVGCPRNEL